jgi:hypothetical protein
MVQVFGDCAREARMRAGLRGLIALWLRTILDVARSIAAAYIAVSRGRATDKMTARLTALYVCALVAVIAYGATAFGEFYRPAPPAPRTTSDSANAPGVTLERAMQFRLFTRAAGFSLAVLVGISSALLGIARGSLRRSVAALALGTALTVFALHTLPTVWFPRDGYPIGARWVMAGAVPIAAAIWLILVLLRRDSRFGPIGHLRQPWAMVVVAACVGIGWSANAALFSVARVSLRWPLPFVDAEALVATRSANALVLQDVDGLSDALAPVVELSAHASSLLSISVTGYPVAAGQAALTDRNYFTLLGKAASRGRLYTAADAGPDIVLSERFWRARFAGDDTILGRTVLVNGVPVEVVGLIPLPPAFARARQADPPDMWVPFDVAAAMLQRSDVSRELLVSVVGRLRGGAPLQELQVMTDLVAPRVFKGRPGGTSVQAIRFGPATGVDAAPPAGGLVGAMFSVLWVLAGSLLFAAAGTAAGLLSVSAIRVAAARRETRSPHMELR